MGRVNYSSSNRSSNQKPERPHAVWRGIGCVFLLIVPVMAFALAVLTLPMVMPWLPYQFTGYPVVSPLLWKVTAFTPLWGWMQNQNNLYAVLLLILVYSAIFGVILTFVYALIYSLFGPKRLGPLDVPQPNVKVKRYKR